MGHSKPNGSGSSYWEASSIFVLTWQQSSAVQGLSWETFIKNKTWRSRLVEGLLCLLHMKLGALLQGRHPGPAGGSQQQRRRRPMICSPWTANTEEAHSLPDPSPWVTATPAKHMTPEIMEVQCAIVERAQHSAPEGNVPLSQLRHRVTT